MSIVVREYGPLNVGARAAERSNRTTLPLPLGHYAVDGKGGYELEILELRDAKPSSFRMDASPPAGGGEPAAAAARPLRAAVVGARRAADDGVGAGAAVGRVCGDRPRRHHVAGAAARPSHALRAARVRGRRAPSRCGGMTAACGATATASSSAPRGSSRRRRSSWPTRSPSDQIPST